MKLNQLKFARAVAEKHSFSQAAEACFVTQPSLSNAIAQLEDELGARIFSRTTRTVELTNFGRYIMPLVNEILSTCEELESASKTYHNPVHKLIRIGLSPLINMRLLANILEPYQREHPATKIFFKECYLNELDHRLSENQIDIMLRPQREVSTKQQSHFFYDESLVYLPGHDNHQQHQVTLNDIATDTFILTQGGCGLTNFIESLFKANQLALTPYSGQALSYDVLQDWASLGIGSAILPKSKVRNKEAAVHDLLNSDKSPIKVPFEIVWHSDQTQTKYLNEFITFLLTVSPKIIPGVA